MGVRIFNLYTQLIFCLLFISACALPKDKENESTGSPAEYDELDYNAELFSSRETSDEMYAKEFPMGHFIDDTKSIERREGKSLTRRQGRAHIRIINKTGKPKTYAKKYRTWMPSKELLKPVHRYGPQKRGPPPMRYKRRRVSGPRPSKGRPINSNALRKQKPPPEPDYEYFSGETFFPEETKRKEERPPRKGGKRKRPKPENVSRRPYDESESISYSNFIKHPSSTASTYDYNDYFDDERPQKKERRRQKKKKKGSKKRVEDEDLSSAYSESSEEANQQYEKYPPFAEGSSHLEHRKRPQRQHNPLPTQPTPIYGDGYIGNKQYQPNGNRNPLSNAGLSRFHSDSQGGLGSEYTGDHFDPYNNYNRNRNQAALIPQQNFNPTPINYLNPTQGYVQPSPQHNIQVAQPNFNLINQLNQQAVNTVNRPANQYQNYQQPQTYNTYQNTAPTQTYQNIIPTTQYSSKYKSSSFFDNTETFQDFNRNVEYSQNSRFGVSSRPSNFVPSSQYQDTAESENSFINKHLELYSNGMKGVPVQGDGFRGDRAHDSRTKDYDIGYGEIQYDETHHT